MPATVLVPHDLTDLADRAFAALALVGPVDRLHVVHVLPRVELGSPEIVFPVEDDEPRRRHARSALQDRLHASHPDALLHVAIGDPASRVVALAREIGADLVVMPTHGRTGLQRLLLGSVAEHVVRFAQCPVLVVPLGSLPAPGVEPTRPDETPEDQLEALAVEVLDQVERRPGQFLTAARIAIPVGGDPSWWEDRLSARLLDTGIAFVDLVVAPGPHPAAAILDLRFEERFT